MAAEDCTDQFTDLLKQRAERNIPKTCLSSKTNSTQIPWFDDNCKKALQEKKKAPNFLNISFTIHVNQDFFIDWKNTTQ